jgi:hypothetical protein
VESGPVSAKVLPIRTGPLPCDWADCGSTLITPNAAAALAIFRLDEFNACLPAYHFSRIVFIDIWINDDPNTTLGLSGNRTPHETKALPSYVHQARDPQCAL